MRAKKFVCCLLAMLLLAGVSFISCGNSSKAKADSELTTQNGEDFKSFLDKFTSSAAFQYTRIKFPLKTPITLLADDGETEKTFPFTKEKWPLLDSETMKEERITQEEGGIYVSKFTLNEPKHKIFEAGYEESEVDLRVEFELQADGKWYVAGDLTLYEQGRLKLTDFSKDAVLKDGDQIITSNISTKFLPGILIGYAVDVTIDPDHLTQSGYLIPAANFDNLQEVLILTDLKDGEEVEKQ